MPSDRVSELLLLRRRTLAMLNEYLALELDVWALGQEDCIREDAIILAELKTLLTEEQWKTLLRGEFKMPSEKETQLYEEARVRAMARNVDGDILRNELVDGFMVGLDLAQPNSKFGTQVFERVKSETNFGFAFVCGVLARLEAVKGKGYQASWQRRGEVDGAMVNIDRKYDRLDAAFRKGAIGETVSQILGDLAVYSAKWAVLRAEINPTEFLAWIKEVQNL